MDEFDSLSEIAFYISNFGLILLGSYFLIRVKGWLLKLSLAIPMLALHFIVLPASMTGCSLSVFEASYCREYFWVYIIFPPAILALGLIELITFEYWHRKSA
jgi:hypothetical protein